MFISNAEHNSKECSSLLTEKFKTSEYVKTLENTAGVTCFKHHAGVQNKMKTIKN